MRGEFIFIRKINLGKIDEDKIATFWIRILLVVGK
jgi:hypothetical protein